VARALSSEVQEQHVDVFIIGGGVAGAVAASVAAKRGLRVCLIKNSHGATGHSSGAFDMVPGGASSNFEPRAALAGSRHWIDAVLARAEQMPSHPYARFRASRDLLADALDHYRSLAHSMDYQLRSGGDNQIVATDLGTLKECLLAPKSQHWDLREMPAGAHIAVAGFEGFSGFDPICAASTLSQLLAVCGKPVRVSAFSVSLGTTPAGDTPAQVIRAFDQGEASERLGEELKKIAGKHETLQVFLLPALLGVQAHERCMRTISQHVPVPVRELVSSQIPSAPGLRLSAALSGALNKLGVDVIEGAASLAHEENGSVKAMRVLPLASAQRPGQPGLMCFAKTVVLCTGRFFAGGMANHANIQEAIFGLPIWADGVPIDDASTHLFTGEHSTDAHALFAAGVHYDGHWRALDRFGNARARNLFVAGSLLHGYDPSMSGTAMGVAAMTGYAAGLSASTYAGAP